MKPITSEGGLVVGKNQGRGKDERIYYIAEDAHSITIGATRSGKSRCLVIQSICSLGLAGESIVVSDPKGELFQYTSEFLNQLDYEVLVLDFKNPDKSQRYNLLQPIIDAIAQDDQNKAQMLALDLTNNIVVDGDGEKIWTNGERAIIAAAILIVVYDNRDQPQFQNLTNVYWFISEMVKAVGDKIPLVEYCNQLPGNHPARALLAISDIAPERTRASFYTSALTTLQLFTGQAMYALTNTSDFHLGEIGHKKQALFFVLPDEKTTYYPICSLIVSQQYEILAQQADQRGGRLKQRVNFLLDEFGNFTKIADFTNKLTVGGGRGMRFNLFVQSFSQLIAKYDEHTANIIKGNCTYWIYLQSDDLETLREISEKLGTYTISSYGTSGDVGKLMSSKNNYSLSLMERKLLTVDEVKRIKRPYQIVTSRENPAIMYAPDLSQWHFNTLLGLGDPKHNTAFRVRVERGRPVITNTKEDIQLWGIWTFFIKDIEERKEREEIEKFMRKQQLLQNRLRPDS